MSIGLIGRVSGTVCLCVGGCCGGPGIRPCRTIGARGSTWHGPRGRRSRPVAVREQGQPI